MNILCLFGGGYQEECDSYITRSVYHEMYLQKVNKSSLSASDEKHCLLDEVEGKS